MATLYEVSQAILNCVEVEPGTTVNMETGEVIDFKALNGLKMERAEKIRNIALWYKDLLSDAEAIKREEQQLNQRRRAAENKALQLKSYLANVLDGEKVKEPQFAISWRKSQAVNITDEKKIPAMYLVPQAPKVSKTEIKKALKAGEDVPGAELQDNVSIQIK